MIGHRGEMEESRRGEQITQPGAADCGEDAPAEGSWGRPGTVPDQLEAQRRQG
jgi:hypothetical protein